MPDLSNRICLVAGASRGVGRGVARALGEAGATVIVTGRSTETGQRTEGRSEVIEDTAREIEAAGGRGHHYVCDHTREREVDTLVSWCLRRFGRIDVLVNAVWGGNEGFDGERHADGSRFGTPFWRRGAGTLGHALETGLYAQFLTSRAVAPAMVSARQGLIVTISFDTGDGYLGDVVYDGAKAAMNRLSLAMGHELKPFGVTALTLSPGFVRTERVIEAGQGAEATETPRYAGRAIAALAGDEGVIRHAGQVLHAADLARRYHFTDDDGSQPERFRIDTEERTP
ncbi:MAG: SDR family NAD(P)-dependent oxidoreductase [Bosea sp.]|jgi:NAD(P)-dependent dehydrogenase (short-subunit alcohol dehydrogenase family)|nr:SDR family NAD(P)-dependent oxidoreductase [Bosea sp. (in: a-proteobacteria)]